MTLPSEPRLCLYGLFHLNLSFSSIPQEHHEAGVDRCYWPLVDLIERLGVPLALEFPAHTLERIREIDPQLLDTIRRLSQDGNCEILASGFIQNILPLVPVEVNRKNLEIGNDIYRELLGRVPDVAYANEQAFSSGLVPLYREAGYRGLIVEWNNIQRYNRFEEELQYAPQVARGPEGETIRIIWNNSVAFQKFQRVVHGQLSLDEYLGYLQTCAPEKGIHSFPIYGNDAEIFDYRPGRDSIASLSRPAGVEFGRIEEIISQLLRRPGWEFSSPGQLLDRFPEGRTLDLCTAEYPIPCKKQQKYNVTRWAVSGRDDLRMNTQCYSLYAELLRAEALGASSDEGLRRLWRDVCYLWGSDFRTHTNDDRCVEFRNQMGAALERVGHRLNRLSKASQAAGTVRLTNPSREPLEKHLAEVDLRCPPGRVPGDFGLEHHGTPMLLQVDHKTLYRDGTLRSARILLELNLPPGESLEASFCEADPSGEAGAPDNSRVERNPAGLKIDTPGVIAEFLEKRGGAISSLTFPAISSSPLAGTLPHGFFDDITLAADFYTGHTILHTMEGQKVTDLSPVKIDCPGDLSNFPFRVPVRCVVETEAGTVVKTYEIHRRSPRVDLTYDLRLQNMRAASLRLGIVTLQPEAFSRERMHYSTVNGGGAPESFPLAGRRVEHGEPVNILVSARHCLGATEGWVSIGDGECEIAVLAQHPLLYSAPMLHYEEAGSQFFCRLYHSVAERDETSESYWRGHTVGRYSLIGHKGDLSWVRRQSRCLFAGVRTKIEW